MATSGSKGQSTWAIIVACGKTEQISPDVETAFLQIGDQPVLAHTLVAFDRCQDVDGIVVVASKDRLDALVGMARLFGTPKLKKVVGGSAQKTSSIKAALGAIEGEGASVIVLHEASQPCVTAQMISETVRGAKRYGVAAAAEKLDIPVVLVTGTGRMAKKPQGGPIWALQMPVAIKRDALEKMLGVGRKAAAVTEANFSERLYKGAYLVPFERANPRIRSIQDIPLAAAVLRSS
jgi:2-C-methyl-D-erythritol 4-phosphate cytidylyltransferase